MKRPWISTFACLAPLWHVSTQRTICCLFSPGRLRLLDMIFSSRTRPSTEEHGRNKNGVTVQTQAVSNTHRNFNASPNNPGQGIHLFRGPKNPEADLIFVHGLGGSWMTTWSWDQSDDEPWPLWLPKDAGLSRVRIFAFNYNANFRDNTTNPRIIDFSQELLSAMSAWNNGVKSGRIGKFPIIFVAHSMGGLVVKGAYVLGKLHNSYAKMINRVTSIIFLATPHKGSTHAHLLNAVLALVPNRARRPYIDELQTTSPTLHTINELFLTACGL
ncbi:hypothetical protein VTJ83DRAFT_2728 [Remersonia thermophila]|uniref:GPI inositol-deacylase n=1 Tax=Remersonia thermophila TaxID=72144 RepID=A0ABR4DKK3_9PEZI